MLKAYIYVLVIAILTAVFAVGIGELMAGGIAHWCSCEPFWGMGSISATVIISGILLILAFMALEFGLF